MRTSCESCRPVTDLADADQWCWATQAGDALRELNQLVDDALAASNTLDIDPAALSNAVDRYRQRSAARCAGDAPAGEQADGQAQRPGPRLLDRQDDYLRFTLDPRVPFDNNAAEREIRMIKLRQKVSGCLRTLTGARQFCAIRSYLATTAKHGIHFFAALTTLAEGRPWLPEARDTESRDLGNLTSYSPGCLFVQPGVPSGASLRPFR